MKMLKYSLFLLAPLGQLSAAVHSFDGLTPDAALTTAETGWTLSESNAGVNGPLAFVGLVGGNVTGALGGEFSDSVNDTVKLTLGSSLVSQYATVSFDMLLKDSSNAFPNRDKFGFVIADGSGASVVTLSFIPVVQSLTPASGAAAQWEVAYTVAGGSQVFTGVALTESAMYFMSVAFSGSTFELDFGNSVTSSSFTGNIPGFNGATKGIGNLSYTWDRVGTAEFGDNSIYFDNISVSASAVPEPSIALLSGLASLGLFRRRRVG